MSELLREQISAFVDDALPAAESELLLRRLQDDEALARTFACYHLIGASLRREPDASALAGRVRLALEHEDCVPKRRAVAWRRLASPAGGAAVAASVALLAIAGLQGLQDRRDPSGAQIVRSLEEPARPVEPESYTVAPRATPAAARELAGRAQLVQYAMRHGNYATMPNPGILNYRTVVGVGPRQRMDAAPVEAPPREYEEPQPQ
jgi:negative regulator of sigma E activity